MAEIDEDDDGLDRWVVRWYRFDPVRRERRHVTVATFDNTVEFVARIDSLRPHLAELKQRGRRRKSRRSAG